MVSDFHQGCIRIERQLPACRILMGKPVKYHISGEYNVYDVPYRIADTPEDTVPA
jgi:hypothetical protein